jgi:hypothetical protein
VNSLLVTIRRASPGAWWETLLWVGYNFLGSLMPIWATFLLLRLHHQHFRLNDFVKHGEFALYTAAFLAPALQLVVRNIKNSKYVLGTGAVLFAVAGLVFSGIIYSGVAPAAPSLEQTGLPPPLGIDERFLFYVSMILFTLSLAFAVLVTLIENQPLSTNIQKSEEEGEKQLADKFSGKKPEAAVGVRDISAAEPEEKELSEEELAAHFKPQAGTKDNPTGGAANG